MSKYSNLQKQPIMTLHACLFAIHDIFKQVSCIRPCVNQVIRMSHSEEVFWILQVLDHSDGLATVYVFFTQ